ncbi:MAG: hypothetical protein COX20_01530 [Desulfobacterales bacterium CG23_combo_of_CG06-09_8_20_14_all_52_9]|nr:MAG: hypothetical protein COX20_01530 [Desulfobacterales bacterium CG23_combo_of_CG06-09_8_20_14_all_52_9]
MHIEKVNIYQIALPFASHFPHALNKGGYAQNVVCEIIAEGGRIRGYGEGAPRTYVTGETPNSAVQDITRFVKLDKFPRDMEHISQIWDFIDSLPKDNGHHAAICALECALLDTFGKKESRYLTMYFSGAFATETVHYGTTIPLLDTKATELLCRRIKDYKINRVRLKVGNNFYQNQANFESIKNVFCDGYDLKIDANGSWSKSDAFDHIPLIEKYHVKVIEQPLNPKDPALSDFARQMNRSKVFVMADESVCCFENIQQSLDQGFTMVNIRLSKCGGFRRSLQMIELARKKNLRFQIGCHLGESGILSAAGRVLALLCKDAIYYDGSYDAYLLKQNITTHPVSFGLGGKARALQGFGLGVEVDLQSLRSLCDAFYAVNSL